MSRADRIARSCTGKLRYLDRSEAKRAAKHAARQTGQQLCQINVYRCPYCTGWHWGHLRKRQRQSLAKAMGWGQ